jgi:hypothetical protein
MRTQHRSSGRDCAVPCARRLIPASYNDDTLPVSGRDDGPARPCARSQGRGCARPASEGSLDESTSRLEGIRAARRSGSSGQGAVDSIRVQYLLKRKHFIYSLGYRSDRWGLSRACTLQRDCIRRGKRHIHGMPVVSATGTVCRFGAAGPGLLVLRIKIIEFREESDGGDTNSG